MNASALLAMLRRHYLPDGRPPGGIFAAEIDSPCGKRRADAIWMPTTWSGGRELIGHELKVTRADVLAELADPTKADAWARYCGYWWLTISDPKLIEGLEDRIPENWGVMSPPSGRRTRSMTIVRPARKLRPVDTGPAFRRLAIWIQNRQGTLLGELRAELQGKQRDLTYAQQQLDQLRASRAAGAGPGDQRAPKVMRILRAVEKQTHERHLYHDVEESDVVAALVDLLAVRQLSETTRYDLQRLVRCAQDLTKPLEHTSKELAKLTAPRVETAAP